MNVGPLALSLLLPVANGLMMYYDDQDIIKIQKIKDEIKGYTNIENIFSESSFLILFTLVTLIHIGILLGAQNNRLSSFGIIIALWISFLISYQISLKKHGLNFNYLTPFSKFQKDIKIKESFSHYKIFDSMKIFKVAYSVLALVFLFLIKENKVINIVLLLSFGFLFQLINSTILYGLIVRSNIIPSVFVYLDEYIKNSNKLTINDKGIVYAIIGLFRIISVLVLSIFLGHTITKNKNTTTKILAIFTIFTFIIASWILIIGDECINERALNYYQGKGYEHKKDLIKYLLPEILQSQGGVTFNISLLIIATII